MMVGGETLTAACGLMERQTTRSTSSLNSRRGGLIPEPFENAVACQHAEAVRDASALAGEPIAGRSQPGVMRIESVNQLVHPPA